MRSRVAGATRASALVITRSDSAARADKTTRRKGPRGRAAGVPWEPGVRIHKTNIRVGSRYYHGSKGSTSRRQRGMIALVCVANRVRAMGSPELPSRLSKAKARAVDYA
jgi:hypothetical protein